MALKRNGPGCGASLPCASCACNGAIDLLVKGCGVVALTGQDSTATLSGGPTAGSVAVNAGTSGHALFTGLDAGTYTVTVASRGYTTGTRTGVVVACGATTTPVDLTLAVLGTYKCCTNLDGLVVPKTLFLTNVYGTTVTLTGTTFGSWTGCAVDNVPGSVSNVGGVCTGGTFGVPIHYLIDCFGAVTILYNEALGGTVQGYVTGTCAGAQPVVCVADGGPCVACSAQNKASGVVFTSPMSAASAFASGPIAGAYTVVE